MNKLTALVALSTTPLSSKSQAPAQTNIKICWEAESAVKIERPLRRVRSSTRIKPSSRDYTKVPSQGYLKMPWVKNHLTGSATYRFRVVNSGRYYVWLRVKYTNRFSNLLHFTVNGGSPKAVGDTASYGFWHWEGGKYSVKCQTGNNILVLKDIDMGIKIDQILLSSSPDFFPTGIRQSTQ